MFRHFFRSTTRLQNRFRWRGLDKPLLGLLGIWLAMMGASQVKARSVTPEQTALEKRVELVRTALDVQSHEPRHDLRGEVNIGPVAQWPNWSNWSNWKNTY